MARTMLVNLKQTQLRVKNIIHSKIYLAHAEIHLFLSSRLRARILRCLGLSVKKMSKLILSNLTKLILHDLLLQEVTAT